MVGVIVRFRGYSGGLVLSFGPYSKRVVKYRTILQLVTGSENDR